MADKDKPQLNPPIDPGENNQAGPVKGFYSRQYYSQEIADLRSLLTGGLEDEISMLRVTMRRFFELANGCEDLETAADILSVISLASTRLASMLKAQKALDERRDDFSRQLSQAINEVVEEMGIRL